MTLKIKDEKGIYLSILLLAVTLYILFSWGFNIFTITIIIIAFVSFSWSLEEVVE